MANTKAYKTARDSSGVIATRVQGPELTIPLYEKGTKRSIRKQGTLYKGTAGTAATLTYTPISTGHSSGTYYKGNGSYVTGRGDSVTAYSISSTYRNAYIYDSSLERYSSIGTVYKVSEKTYYKGNGSSGYLRGSSVDAIEYDGTLYEKGTTQYATVITDEYTGGLYQYGILEEFVEQPEDPYAAALFLQDQNSYAGGLYYDIQLANFTTRAATLLQA